ncbi:MAG: ATP-binding protein [Maritimibacter sp.]
MGDGSAVISGEELVCMSHQEIQTAFSGKALCVDAIEGVQIARIESIIRSCAEHRRSAPKFILVGRNAKTDQLLSSALIGIMTDLELTPIQVIEHLNDSKPLMTTQGPSSTTDPQAQSTNAPVWSKEALWLRGGLPESLNADSDEQSFGWRSDYLASLLNQDFDCWSIDASDRLPEVFQYVANNNGEQFDDANCANTLSVKRDSVRKSLNLLERTGLLRRLQNWPAGSNQSLNSMPVFYVRDCGLLHAALGIRSMEDLRGHDAIGHSWESFAIEAIVNASSGNATPAFYRDKEQNEIDLVLSFHSGHTFAIEFKVNEAVKAKKGFAIGCHRIGATHTMVVHAGEVDHSLDGGVSRRTLVSALRSIPQ